MRAIFTILMVVVLGCAGCRTMQPVETQAGAPMQSKVHAGDTVEVVTRDGAEHRFEVTTVSADSISGAPGTFTDADIQSLRVLKVSKARAAAIGVGSVAAGYVLLSAMAAVFVLGAL